VKISLNIILPSTPGSPQWSLFLWFPHQKPFTRLSPPPYELHAPPINILLDYIILTMVAGEYRSLTSSLITLLLGHETALPEFSVCDNIMVSCEAIPDIEE
jgi:hypothetical protein